jgi:hypothetical protein
MKTVRFAKVIERSGRPRIHALWVAPERDEEFGRARKANRVMTITAGAHGKKDVGHAGYEPPQPGRQYLVFPKTLGPFAGARVVGVNFDWVGHLPSLAAAHREPSHHRRQGQRTRTKEGQAVDERPPTPSAPAKSLAQAGNPHAGRLKSRRRPPQGRRNSPANHRESGPRDKGSDLVDEVQLALEELRRGQTVAAYERLQKALATTTARSNR